MVTIAELQKKQKVRRAVLLEMRDGAGKTKDQLESAGLRPRDVVEMVSDGWMNTKWFGGNDPIYFLTEAGKRLAKSYAMEDAEEPGEC